MKTPFQLFRVNANRYNPSRMDTVIRLRVEQNLEVWSQSAIHVVKTTSSSA